ncbi:chitinase [Paenibacillus uliginis N3/975]|uniref:chitinase n=1 Tax=Paenibacillus uliginis N3/975 TaxID=1313296 RepID=A0A1X7GH42_9BACL|nr:glycosyl hydrolase family 18 protein [Paenibacillus uliginis]SMF69629.1 chitinase [Paenibacillus uliginis N3/975]
MHRSGRKKYSNMMVLFLSMLLAFGTLFNAPTSYAETDVIENPAEAPAPEEVAPGEVVPEEVAPVEPQNPEGTPQDPEALPQNPEAAPQKPETAQESIKAANVGPKNLRVVEVTHNTVSLEWDPAPDIKHYWIWDTNNKYIFWANDGAQTVGGLTPSTTYSFYVGPNGVQAPNLTPEQKSNVVTFTTLEDVSEYKDPPLTPPSYLTVTDVTYNSVTLGWGGVSKATGYDFYVNGQWINGIWSNTVTSITYAPESGMELGRTYTFEVGAQNPPNPVSANSNKVKITWGELSSPEDLQVITATRTTASLGWAPVPGATSYDIFQDGKLVGSSETNRFVANGLTEGQNYSFTVVAKNNLWESPASSEKTVVPGSEYTNVTYYTSWSGIETRNFKPTDIDVSQITHINYAFADLCWKKYGTGAAACQNENIPLQKDYVFDGEMIIGDPEVDINNFETFANIRNQNPHLKMMISVGGWTWSKNFSNIAATEETRHTFANSVVKFLREYRLDGVDIDWEYPVEGGEDDNSRRPEDKENFTLLMKTVRDALDGAGSEDGKYYLLTIASGQGDNFVVNADFVNSASYLDFINIMTYDYSGKNDVLGHHNAPLFYDKNHPGRNAPRNNVQGGALGHLNGGVPKHKLVLGIPFYGKGYRDCLPNGQYRTCAGGTETGTWEANLFDYTDLERNYVNKNGYVRYWNEASKVAYLYNSENKVFITYNDKESMLYSASLVKSLDIAGVMSWDISGDRNKTLNTQLVHDLPINGTVNTSQLTAPSQISVTSKQARSLQLKWNASEGATGYEVYVNKQWVGNITEPQYTINALKPDTEYSIHVLAIEKANETVQRVSRNSDVLKVTTSSDPVTPPSSGGGGGETTTSPPTTPVPTDKDKNELGTRVSKNGNTTVVTLTTDAAAIKKIADSASTTFNIVIDSDGGKPVELTVPQQIIAAIAKKGEEAALSIRMKDAEYSIPIHAIHGTADIKISFQTPEQSVLDQMKKGLGSKGITDLVQPFELKIEQIASGQTAKSLTDIGKYYISRVFTLNAKDIDVNRISGVIFIPGSNELRPVPTVFKVNADGTVTVEMKTKGSGMYALIKTNYNFLDATKGWLQKDVHLAAAKLIASGESANIFGVNKSATRAEVVSMIVRGLGIVPDSTSSAFKDVDVKSKYAGDIAAASKLGLIQGKTKDTFDPDGLVTRQEIAVMLANAMKYAGKTGEAKAGVLGHFVDQSAISSYAKSSVAFIVQEQIMNGVSKTRLDPQSNVTKAQTAVSVMRMLRSLQLSN